MPMPKARTRRTIRTPKRVPKDVITDIRRFLDELNVDVNAARQMNGDLPVTRSRTRRTHGQRSRGGKPLRRGRRGSKK